MSAGYGPLYATPLEGAWITVLTDLYVRLLALERIHWSAHLITTGPSAYQDHLLYERLYKATQEALDTVGERLAALGDGQGLDARQNLLQAAALVPSTRLLLTRSLEAETALVASLNDGIARLRKEGPLPADLDDLLLSQANDAEARRYFLLQRSRGSHAR